MKKRLLAVVTLIIALVMSFSLVACGNKNKGGKDKDNQPPALTGTMLGTAFDKLQNAKTVEFDFDASTSSDGGEGFSFDGKVVVSGNKGAYTDPQSGNKYIVDMDSGYCYTVNAENKCIYYDQTLPGGMMSYVDDVISATMGGASASTEELNQIAAQFTYDATYGGYVAKTDVKDKVNELLAFVQGAYADDAKLIDIADDLLKAFTGEQDITFETFMGTLVDSFDVIKAMSISQLLDENADAVFDEVFAALAQADISLDATQKAAIKARKIGELLAGAMTVIPDVMEQNIDPEAIMEALFFTTVTPAQVDAVAAQIETSVDYAVTFLKENKFRTFVDQAPADIQAMVKTDGFAFEKISAELGLKIANGNVTEIKLDGAIKHNYSGSDYTDTVFVGDNNYVASFVIGVQVKDSVTTFNYTFDNDVEVNEGFYAMVKGYGKSAEIYFETAGKTVVVSDIAVYDFSGSMPELIQDAGVTFNAEKSCFAIPSELIEKLVDDESYRVLLSYTVKVGDGDEEDGGASIQIMPDKELSTLVDYVMSMLG